MNQTNCCLLPLSVASELGGVTGVMTAASNVRNFKSITTLIVFIFTSLVKILSWVHLHLLRLLSDVVVVFPFHLPIPIPHSWRRRARKLLVNMRILSASHSAGAGAASSLITDPVKTKPLRFPINPATAPVISVLFLLACTAIHRKEVHDGILGSDG